jgi:signal transduction histidine kinase
VSTFDQTVGLPTQEKCVIPEASAAEWFVTGFAKRSGITAKCDFATESQRLPATIETALFRVLQESLTNVHRYSGPPEVSVRFLRAAEVVTLEIRDIGHGMSSDSLNRLAEASPETGVGLAGMRD